MIALNWKLKKTKKGTVEYKALVEVKTPTAADRKHAESEIKEYLEKVPFVILTDCVTWEFYMKENDSIYSSFYSLEKERKVTHLSRNKRFRKELKLQSRVYEFPSRVCERYQTAIVWNDTDWEAIKQTVQDLVIKKENRVTL